MDSRETTFEHQRVAAARFNNIFLKLFDRHQWRIQDFFLGGGALVSCSTSTPVNQIVFFLFCRIPIVLENRRSSQRRGGGAHPLHSPPRSAPGHAVLLLTSRPQEFLIERSVLFRPRSHRESYDFASNKF